MNIHIETDRFIMRDIEFSDDEGMFLLDSDPDVHIFLGNNPVQTIEQSRNMIDDIRKQYKEFGIGRWAIVEKKSGEFVGWSGIRYEQNLRAEFNYYDIGYRLRKKFWGQGFATEAARESIKYAFNTMKLEQVGAAADVQHTVSNVILKKIGMKFIELFEYDNLPHNWYTLDRKEWLNKA